MGILPVRMKAGNEGKVQKEGQRLHLQQIFLAGIPAMSTYDLALYGVMKKLGQWVIPVGRRILRRRRSGTSGFQLGTSISGPKQRWPVGPWPTT